MDRRRLGPNDGGSCMFTVCSAGRSRTRYPKLRMVVSSLHNFGGDLLICHNSSDLQYRDPDSGTRAAIPAVRFFDCSTENSDRWTDTRGYDSDIDGHPSNLYS